MASSQQVRWRGRRLGPRRWWLVASMVVVAALSWVGLPLLRTQQLRWQAQDALGTLTYCLHGGENAGRDDQLMRRRLIAVASGANPSPAWPGRCDRFALALQVAVGALEQEHRARCSTRACCDEDPPCASLARLRASLDMARTALRDGEAQEEQLGEILPLARSAGLEPTGVGQGPPPPQEVELHSPSQMTPLSLSPAELLTDPPGTTPLRLLLYDRQRRHGLCAVDLSDASTARCRPLPLQPAGAGMGQLLASEPGAPPLLVAPGPPTGGARWPHELFDASSGRRMLVVPDRPRGGFGWSDGTAAVLSSSPDEETAALYFTPAEGPRHTMVLTPPTRPEHVPHGPHLLFDELLWTLAGRDGSHLLFASRIRPEADHLPAPQLVGSTGPLGDDITLEPCRTAQMLAVLARGQPQGYTTRVAFAFRFRDGWRPPVEATIESDWFGLTCHDDAASLSWIAAQYERRLEPDSAPGSPVEGDYRLHRVRCGSSGCRHSHSDVHLRRHSRASRYVVGDLGDTVMLLWRSPLGDVRMRVAPLDELAEAPDTPLFDDEAHEGFAWELRRGGVFARERSALLVIKAPRDDEYALYGLRIDDRGHTSPVRVAPASTLPGSG